MKLITHADCKLMDQLMARGTRLDPTAVKEARIACRALKIKQTGNSFENELALQAGFTFASKFSLCTWLVIENVSNRFLYFTTDPVTLNFPWINHDFRLLDDNEAWRSGRYVLSPCARQFPFDMVLNHHLKARRKLRPGYKLSGWLLGEGATFMPLEYSHREPVDITIHANTETGTDSNWIRLYVDRLKPEPAPERRSIPKRKSILESKDLVPVK